VLLSLIFLWKIAYSSIIITLSDVTYEHVYDENILYNILKDICKKKQNDREIPCDYEYIVCDVSLVNIFID